MRLLNAIITKIGAIVIMFGITLLYSDPKNHGTKLQLTAINPNIIGKDKKNTNLNDLAK